MRLRWKILILLLVIAIVPLTVAALIARSSGRRMGREMIGDISQVLLTQAHEHLRQISDRAVATLQRDQSIVETAVDMQARALERLIADGPPTTGRVYFDDEFDDPRRLPPGTAPSPGHVRYEDDGTVAPMNVSYDVPAIRLLPGAEADVVGPDIARLNAMRDTFSFLRRRNPDLILWQYATMETGVHCSYPGHGGYPESYDSRTRAWYDLARQSGESIWAPPIVDASSRQILMTCVRAVLDKENRFVGVTGIDVPMIRVLDGIQLPAEWRERAKVAVNVLVQDEDSGAAQLRVMAQRDYSTVDRAWNLPIELEVLGSPDADEFESMLERIREGAGSMHRMPYQGRDALWVSGPMRLRSSEYRRAAALALVIIVPFSDVIAELDRTEAVMQVRLDRQFQFTGALLVAVIVIVAVISLWSSRMVTRPIRLLAQTARSISQGDLQARAEVRSGDEIGELAGAFNAMVPKLQDRIKLKESLALAMDVQQHLLPDHPPQIDGLDIAGKSVYCDETGGDYYDFLHVAELGSGQVGIAIGDVTGHGIAAALLMASARSLLRIRAPQSGDLAQVITDMNRYLEQDTPAGRFMTFYFLRLDARARSAHWVSAGHDPAILFDPADGSFVDLEGMDIPLGVDPAWTFHEASRSGFRAGQILMLGTDGIWESRNDADEMFGKDRLREVIRNSHAKPAEIIVDDIIMAIDEFRAGQPQEDDITLIVIKFTS